MCLLSGILPFPKNRFSLCWPLLTFFVQPTAKSDELVTLTSTLCTLLTRLGQYSGRRIASSPLRFTTLTLSSTIQSSSIWKKKSTDSVTHRESTIGQPRLCLLFQRKYIPISILFTSEPQVAHNLNNKSMHVSYGLYQDVLPVPHVLIDRTFLRWLGLEYMHMN